MSGSVILGVAGAWLAIGLALSLAMGCRGHDRFSWLVLGTTMGPVALALAFVSWRDERLGTLLVVGTRGSGRGHGATAGGWRPPAAVVESRRDHVRPQRPLPAVSHPRRAGCSPAGGG